MNQNSQSSEQKKLISIGLPVFNGEDYLAESLDSLLAQDYENLEFIISDNGSTDNTSTICETYAAKDQRITYHRHEVNRGAMWNFDYCFRQARGEYFMWASTHDLWENNYVSSGAALLDQDQSVVLVYPHISEIDAQSKVTVPLPVGIDTRGLGRPMRTRIIVQHKNPGYMFYGLFRRSVLSQCRLGFSSWGPDIIILMEVGLYGAIAQLPETLFYHRDFREKADLKKRIEDQAERIDPLLPKKKYLIWDMGKHYVISTLHAKIPILEKPYVLLNVVYSFVRRWRTFLIKDLIM